MAMVLQLTLLTMLSACGGGGGGGAAGAAAAAGAAQTLTGTVATGAPSAGATITVKDATGKTATGMSAANGTYSVGVTGLTPPFMLVATKVGQTNMYSVLPAMDMTATNTQNVNITQVTTLVMYELNGGNDPASMYTSGSFSTVTAANVSAKQTIVRSKIPANAVNPIFDMMYDRFVASVTPLGSVNADPYDRALDALGRITGMTAAGVTLSLAPAYTPAAAGAAIGAPAAPTITLALSDTAAPFAARTSIANTLPARVTATVKNANGVAVQNAIVTFKTSDPRDTFSGGANTALTDINGNAWVVLTTSNTGGGASTVTADTNVNGAAVTNSMNYAIGASAITLSPITLPAVALSAYGTASVSVTVLNNGVPYTTPMTVNFTSACASTGKATLTSSVTTVNGVATASYLDNGCNNTIPGDVITASLMNGVTATGNMKVNSPAIGSIQFVSVVTNPATNPTMITLKGTGGAGRSETARVTFRVVDSAGNPFSAPVTFSLNTTLGGLALSSYSAVSDPITGNAVTNVIAGSFSTGVRVTATTGALSSQSDQLLVSTGIPAQDSFSLSASTHNIEGWVRDGTLTTLTARLADHFHNPVPDGTAVYFTTEGGAISPSCTTVGGACSVTMSSQALRPTNGRVTVLARAIGEEAFIDLNSNGTVDSGPGAGTEMIDANGVSTDMGEAYLDYNENGIHDVATEPFIDFNVNGLYDGTTNGLGGVGDTATGDTKYNGILCTAGAAICSLQKSIDVRASQVIVFSDSTATVNFATTAGAALGTVALQGCTGLTPGAAYTFNIDVYDLNGNAMPAGSVINLTASNGVVTSAPSYIVPDTAACRTGVLGCPAKAASATLGQYSVTMKSDAVLGVPCTDPTGTAGTLTVKVTTPAGLITTRTITVTD